MSELWKGLCAIFYAIIMHLFIVFSLVVLILLSLVLAIFSLVWCPYVCIKENKHIKVVINEWFEEREEKKVDSEYADTTDGTPLQAGCAGISATLGVSFSLCSDGDITVLDSAGGNNVATNITAIVVSHGKNWGNSTSADEAENTDGDAVFVDKDYSQATGAEYDDILIWISPHILNTMSVKAGILP